MWPFEKFIIDYDAMCVVGTAVYYGWCDFGCSGVNDNKWMIVKHELVDGFYTRTWANGKKTKNLVFANCAAYTNYKHLI